MTNRETNPFAAPATADQVSISSTLSPELIREPLRITRRWVRLVSLVVLILFVIFIVSFGMLGGVFGMAAAGPFEVGAIGLCVLIYGIPLYFLRNYAKRIDDFLNEGHVSSLVDALTQQRSFWVYATILLAFALVLNVGLFAIRMMSW